MKGEERYLVNLLEGTKTRFHIPVYQRNYDWRIEDCKQLFDDLEELAVGSESTHFFGSIVSQADGDVRIVIDGQQRITTSYLLLLALVHLLQKGSIVSEDANLAEMINEEYLIDKWHKNDSKLKLKLIKDDQRAFEAIYSADESKFISTSNITVNYNYFRKRIASSELSADQLQLAIEKLMVIDIKLDGTDDAQRIFESLNSTGLELSEGDKIRNFILMGLDSESQEKYYEEYWNRIEKNTDYDVSSFARDWLAATQRKTPAIKKVYAIFKNYVRDNGIETNYLLENLLRHSEYYRLICKHDSGNASIDAVLKRLVLLDTSVVNPYLLNLFEYRETQKITDAEIAESLEAIENYIFRRWVCKVPTNALNKVFETLHSETLRGAKNESRYPDVLKYILLAKEGSGRYPRDEEFLDEFERRDFYRIGAYRFYLYDKLENGNSLERVNVVGGMKEDRYTVEHVMPQSLSPSWKEDLGADYERVHNRWLNSLANLTLTAYNSQYSNKRFIDKRDAEGGFKDTGFRMSKQIADSEKWTEAELEQRNKWLKKRFLELWPTIETSYMPAFDMHEEVGLDEDFEFTNRKIAAYTFLGSRFTTRNWAEMICGVLSSVYDLDPSALLRYIPDGEFPARFFFSEESDYCYEIASGLYFNPGSSTLTKIDILKRVFSAAQLDASELTFELYRNKEEE